MRHVPTYTPDNNDLENIEEKDWNTSEKRDKSNIQLKTITPTA